MKQSIKNWLKKFFPLPVKTFNREIHILKQMIAAQNKAFLSALEKNNYLIKDLALQLSSLSSKAEALDNIISVQNQLITKQEALDNNLISNQAESNEKMTSIISIQNQLITKQEEMVMAIEKRARRKLPNTDIQKQLWDLAGRQTAEYVSENMYKCKVFSAPDLLREYAVSQAGEGLYLEFGVYSGKTINQIADLKKDRIIYGFDSFEGLPETWRSGFEAGKFLKDTLPEVRDNVTLMKGWFDQTLPSFIQEHNEICAFIHIDCDLYSSSKTVLDFLAGRIVKGTIILFDEYFNYPGWKHNEFKAFQEFISASELKYEYIGYVKDWEQTAVKII